MRLLLFSGFLGSGKTTLVIKLVQFAANHGKKVAILVNEIGEVGIDNQLMRQLDMNVWELLNGCICCTLSADLVSTLEKLDAEYSLDLVIIEPSGAADPQNVLSALPYYKGSPLEYIQTISILDPLRVEVLMEVLTPLIISQIKHADLILISKRDQAKAEELAYAHQVAREHNPGAKVMELGEGDPLEFLVKELTPWMN